MVSQNEGGEGGVRRGRNYAQCNIQDSVSVEMIFFLYSRRALISRESISGRDGSTLEVELRPPPSEHLY